VTVQFLARAEIFFFVITLKRGFESTECSCPLDTGVKQLENSPLPGPEVDLFVIYLMILFVAQTM
jgi:hypothetical protein